ncbi:glycosyltransferase [Litoricolaceae bacterium]|nr:glycosyltransferase [Litorivicinaceae bacterium]
MKIFVPFDAPQYMNGAHPLVDSFTRAEYEGLDISFCRSFTKSDRAAEYLAGADLLEKLFAICDDLSMDDWHAWSTVGNLIWSRRPDIQARIPISCDLVYHHTVPYSLDTRDFILHIETVSQIFQPFISQGTHHNCELIDHFAFHFVRFLLESDRCKRVFTNLNFTLGQIDRVFRSETITNKSIYIAPSSYLVSDSFGKSDIKRRTDDDIQILFTNSLADSHTNFYFRGGLHILLTVLKLSAEHKKVSLVIRSSVPPEIKNSELWDLIQRNPKIQWIEDRLSESALINLYREADIFFLYSNAVHSLSILRSMAMGLVVIGSDVPGVDEYITDGIDGFIVRGQRDLVCKLDSSTGWIFDDYSKFFEVIHNGGLPPGYEHIKVLISSLLNDPAIIRYISQNAKNTALNRFGRVDSLNQFGNMIESL